MTQAEALTIMKAGRNVYLTGAAGSGKTHVLNKYIRYLKERGVSVAVTASTGIAATHIGGTTIHSWSGAGIRDNLTPEEIDRLTQKEYLYKRFEKTKVLIIDEVSMLSPQLFDTVEEIARAMKGSAEPFGGMQVVLSGDFFQLPPITPGRNDAVFITASRAWQIMDVRVCYLKEQFRQSDMSLEALLSEMRQGTLSDAHRALLYALADRVADRDPLATRLYTHNVNVDAENDAELAKLPGEAYTYEMKTKGRRVVVEGLVKSILAPETLHLKKGAAVMFVKNAFDEGYVNGTLGVVEDFDDYDAPVVKTRDGRTITVSEAEWTVEEDGKVRARVVQMPLRLAWAITVHKSQGMSLDAAQVDLSRAFVAGQGYVALSRLRSLEGLSLSGISEMAFAVHPEVRAIDAYLERESKKWEQVIARFSKEEMADMHRAFIERAGGTTDPAEIKKNIARMAEGEDEPERVSTYEKTRALVEEGKGLSAIAEARGLTEGTIISHLEKLKEQDPSLDLSLFKPAQKDLKKIAGAFAKVKSGKLTPVHRALKGAYTFEELRLARLFI